MVTPAADQGREIVRMDRPWEFEASLHSGNAIRGNQEFIRDFKFPMRAWRRVLPDLFDSGAGQHGVYAGGLANDGSGRPCKQAIVRLLDQDHGL